MLQYQSTQSGETLKITQQSWGTTGGKQHFRVGEIKLVKITKMSKISR